MTISILKAERFYPLGKPLPRPEEAKDVVDAVQIRPGIWRKPDGTMETRGYETPKPTTKPVESSLPATPSALAIGDRIVVWRESPMQDGVYEVGDKGRIVRLDPDKTALVEFDESPTVNNNFAPYGATVPREWWAALDSIRLIP
jgi:hypothetical protein